MLRLAAVCLLLLAVVFTVPVLADDDYWRSLGGPLGGDVRCFALDPVVPTRVYLGLGSHASHGGYAEGGGLFYSTDFGERWIRGTLQNVKVAGVVKSHGNLWVATYGNGVFLAPNPRDEWASANDGLDNLHARSITATPEHIILGTDSGPFYADPTERQWMAGAIESEREFWALQTAPWDSDFVLAATDSGVWRSTDGGQSWSFSGTGIDQHAVRSIAVAEGGLCWAGSFDGWNDPAKLYCSSDTGQTWVENYVLPEGQGDAVWAILPTPDYVLIGTGWLGSSYGHIYRSSDGGTQWELITSVFYKAIRAFQIVPSQAGRVLAGCESSGGVLCSTDSGLTWAYRLSGLDAGNVYEIELIDGEAGTMATGVGFTGAFSMADNWGESWTRLDSLFSSTFIRGLAVLPGEPQRLLAAAWNGIYMTDNLGQTWTRQTGVSQNVAIDLCPLDADLVYAGGANGLVISRDGGSVWEEPDSMIGYGVQALAVDPRDGWRALVATWEYLFETRDAAASWDTLEVSWPRSVAFHPVAPEWIYVGTSQGVYISNDNGETFIERSNGLPGVDVNEIISDPDNPGVVWAGTPVGVYKTITDGAIWFEDNRGLENRDVRAFMIHHESRRIFTGSYSGGVRFAFLNGANGDGSETSTALPVSLRLKVDPIPCTDQLYVLPALQGKPASMIDRSVNVTLYSLDGRQLRSVTSDVDERLVWNMVDIPAGAYVLRASSQASEAVAPVVVVP